MARKEMTLDVRSWVGRLLARAASRTTVTFLNESRRRAAILLRRFSRTTTRLLEQRLVRLGDLAHDAPLQPLLVAHRRALRLELRTYDRTGAMQCNAMQCNTRYCNVMSCVMSRNVMSRNVM